MDPDAFYVTLEAPGLYTVAYENLSKVNLEISGADGTKLAGSYEELHELLIAEGVLDCEWGLFPRIKTSKNEYRRSAYAQEQAAWRVLCLDCHIAAKRGATITHLTWFAYSHTFSDDNLAVYDAFFVVLDSEIIDSRFMLIGHAPVTNPTGKLLKSGIWQDARPVAVPEGKTAASLATRDEAALRIGWARACYRRFYEETDTGRALAMAPGADRFDALAYWADGDDSKATSTVQLSRQLDSLAEQLRNLQALVKLILGAGIAVAIARWIWS